MILDIMLRKGWTLLFVVLGVALIGKGWHWAKDGFDIKRTHFPLEIVASDPLDGKVSLALSQPYHYLSRGHQCYAFESADGKYILKLPRYDRYTLPFWLRSCQFRFLEDYREEQRADKEKRLYFTLNSFQIAFEELKEETALLYLHLGRTNNFGSHTQITDRIGRSYSLDLDATAFILQRKKALMMPAFKNSLAAGDRARAKEILGAFLEIVAIRARKGIFNKDPSFLRNFGYDGKGVQIDIGSFYRRGDCDPATAFGPSFLQTVGHVQSWLSEEDPEIAAWFKTRTEEIIE